MKRALRYIFSNFSVLAIVPAEGWVEAFYEVGLASFFSALPILLGAIYYYGFKDATVGQAIRAVVQQGELAVLSAASIGPILYLVGKNRSARFPLSLLFSFFNYLLLGLGIVVFIHSKVAETKVSGFFGIVSSAVIYLICQIMTFIATAIRNSPWDPAQVQLDGEKDFTDQFDNEHPE